MVIDGCQGNFRVASATQKLPPVGLHSAVLFDLQPVLRGELVTVRPLRSADFAALYEVARDPLVWAQHPVRDRHRVEVFSRFFAESLASGGALAVTSAAGDLIGSSRFHGHDRQRREVEIGWTLLARSHWGGQVNGELKKLMIDHALRFVDRVVFLAGPDNHRSRPALEKIGAVRAPAPTPRAARASSSRSGEHRPNRHKPVSRPTRVAEGPAP